MLLFRWLTAAALLLCLTVVVFGAYVRLSHAGLGCPDWPGCYGQLTVPTAAEHVAQAQEAFPDRPVEPAKAWKEMIHRYLASTLGLLIAGLALLSFRPGHPRRLPRVLLALVIFQGVLGMWTVTWLLKPLVVTAHLLGGMTTLALLLWLWLDTRASASGPVVAGSSREPRNEREAWSAIGAPAAAPAIPAALRLWAGVALALLAAQIFLGGWTSSNYAALACPDLPTCHGTMFPEMDVPEAFTLWRGLGQNYEHGVLDNRARVTIHWLHRIGALVVSAVLVALGAWLWHFVAGLRRHGQAIIGALTVQAALGASLVYFQLPLPVAAAHNAGAALLLLAVTALTHRAWRASP
jgi:heme a synthase